MELPPQLRFATPVEVAERVRAERRARPFLLLRDGDGRQRIVDLGGDQRSLAIGRDPSSDVALTWDSEVSRAHALLECVGDTWTLVDDGLSHNGSFVNGERVRGRRRLEDRDAISVGRTVIAFLAGAAPATLPTETTSRSARPDLSPAQRRVLEALCRPYAESPFAGPPSNREIAEELVVGVETVKTHLRTLFELFDVADMPQNRKRAELVRRAFERGAVTP
jgi:pSer/pThr/pTyr-binding forkhead associated (FHA) protein